MADCLLNHETIVHWDKLKKFKIADCKYVINMNRKYDHIFSNEVKEKSRCEVHHLGPEFDEIDEQTQF